MCTVVLPPGVNPLAVNKYIIYHITCGSPIGPLCCTVCKMFRHLGWTGKTRSSNSITWRFSTPNFTRIGHLIWETCTNSFTPLAPPTAVSQPTLRTTCAPAGAQHQANRMTAAAVCQYTHRHGTTFLLQMAHPPKIMLLSITVASSVFQRNLQYSQCRKKPTSRIPDNVNFLLTHTQHYNEFYIWVSVHHKSIICVFVVLCMYRYSYFRCRTAG